MRSPARRQRHTNQQLILSEIVGDANLQNARGEWRHPMLR
jgi:hypothetical protein